MSKNRYIVTGIHAVLGHAPGAEFSADIPEEQESALIGGGAIVRKTDFAEGGVVPAGGKRVHLHKGEVVPAKS